MIERQPVILGIDLGARSIGWCVMACDADQAIRWEPTALLDAGARCFEAGVDGNLDQGKDEARAVARRLQRGARRQLFRRSQRLRRTLRALTETGFLPGAIASPPEARHEFIHTLDARLKTMLIAEGEPPDDVSASPLYQIRRRCLDGRRSLEEIGRAFFHLAQRRGFKSNRKDNTKEDEKGVVKKGISDLARSISAAGSRTLGEYFSTLNPHLTRIRSKWTARSMYEEEFVRIWAAQAGHHPSVMTYDAMKKIYNAIFYQRPLKSSRKLVGFANWNAVIAARQSGASFFRDFGSSTKSTHSPGEMNTALSVAPLVLTTRAEPC